MLKRLFVAIGVIALTAATCGNALAQKNEKKEVSESEAYEKFKNQSNDGKHFGQAVNAKGAMTYDKMLKKMSSKKSLDNVKVTGTVDAVCKMKGCWMNIKSDAGAEPMFVQFKDYAFFMPKDIAGKKVVMVGNAFKETTSVEELRHFAEDEGKSKEEIAKITKPKEEVKFMASGVVILDK